MNWRTRSYRLTINAAVLGLFACAVGADAQTAPPFFNGAILNQDGSYSLTFSDGSLYGTYTINTGTSELVHRDMGAQFYEADSNTTGGLYLLDWPSNVNVSSANWWWTSSSLFPYISVLSGPLAGDWLWYWPDYSKPASPGDYTSTPRVFANLTTGQTIMLDSAGNPIQTSKPTTSLSIAGASGGAVPANTPVTLTFTFAEAAPNTSADIFEEQIDFQAATDVYTNNPTSCNIRWTGNTAVTPPMAAMTGPTDSGFCTVLSQSVAYSPLSQPGGSVTVTVQLSIQTPGYYAIQSTVIDMQGLSSSVEQLGYLTVGVPFSLSISPASQTVAPGGTATFNVSAANSVSGQPPEPVNLIWQNPGSDIAGFGCSNLSQSQQPSIGYAPPSPVVTTGQTTAVTLSPSASSGPYTCTFGLVGELGAFSSTVTDVLNVTSVPPSPSYTTSTPSPYPLAVTPGTAGYFTFWVTPQNGYSGTVTFTGAPTGSSPACSGGSITVGSTAVSLNGGGQGLADMYVDVPAGCPAGTTYAISISSSSSTTVSPAPPPVTVPLTVGQTVTVTPLAAATSVTVDGNQYSGAVSLSAGSHTLSSASSATRSGAVMAVSYFDGANRYQTAAPPVPNPFPSGSCPWTCSGGQCSTPLQPATVSPAPTISGITGLGGQPAALLSGGTSTIVITGNNFGNVAGLLGFCAWGASPCQVIPTDGTPMAYGFNGSGDSWTNTQIVANVTLPSGVTEADWGIYVISDAWITAIAAENPDYVEVPVEPAVTVAMTLAQVGPTVISTDGNYSEDATVSVTAVDASSGAPLTTWSGTVNIAEDTSIPLYVPIYSQNPGILPVYLPASVNLVNGAGQFVAHSLAGPGTPVSATSGGTPPSPAQIKTTNFPLYQPNPAISADLAIPQWIASGAQIDTHANSTAVQAHQVYDWVQARAQKIFANASGDAAAVLNTISSYTLQALINENENAAIQHGGPAQTPIVINPYSNEIRTDSAQGNQCGCSTSHTFTFVLLHEARHAYQASIGTTANDVDQDYLVYLAGIGIAPTTIFLDSTTARTVCDEQANNGNGSFSTVGYLGDSNADAYAKVDLALELDADVFAAGHTPGSAPPAALAIASTHNGNFTQGQQGATYTITVSNAAGFGPTSGAVTVTDALDTGLTLVSTTGSGWSCSGVVCTTTNVLSGGSSYPAITVTVNVAPNASSTQVNTVSFSGGGSVSAITTATDNTTINPQ